MPIIVWMELCNLLGCPDFARVARLAEVVAHALPVAPVATLLALVQLHRHDELPPLALCRRHASCGVACRRAWRGARVEITPSRRRRVDGLRSRGASTHPDGGVDVQRTATLLLVTVPHALDVADWRVACGWRQVVRHRWGGTWVWVDAWSRVG